MMGKALKIDGIKFSEELVLLNLPDSGNTGSLATTFLHLLARNRINIPFVTLTRRQSGLWLTGCVGVDKMDQVGNLLQEEPELVSQLEAIPSVGLLTLFPHRAGLRILGLALATFDRAQLPLYGLASSLSALTFVTGFSHLDRAVEYLEEVVVLPENHAPFKPQFRIKHVTR